MGAQLDSWFQGYLTHHKHCSKKGGIFLIFYGSSSSYTNSCAEQHYQIAQSFTSADVFLKSQSGIKVML